MATDSCSSPIIYSIGKGSDDSNINVVEHIRALLEKFKDTECIVYVNLEKLILDSDDTHRDSSSSKTKCRSRSISRSRGHSRPRSRSRSRSHSHPRRPRLLHRQHSRGHRFPMHFLHKRSHHHDHHHGRHHFSPYYYSSEVEETGCEVTLEGNRTEDPCCRIGRRRHRGKAMRRLECKSLKHGNHCPKQKDNVQTTESEDHEVITINEDEPMNSVNADGSLEVQVDGSNVSKAP